MPKRRLGQSELEVAPLAFGGNVFGWTADENMSFKLLDRFVDAGLNLIDTADVYSAWHPGNKGGESEEIIGRWLKRSKARDRVLIATKVGLKVTTVAESAGLKRKYILDSVDQSLKRLQIDYIDLYQAHKDDEQTPLEETLDTFDELIKRGKVRYIGASNYSAERLKEALNISKLNGLARFESMQPEYNLYERKGYEDRLEPLCLAHKLGVISYFSLARGFLSGKYRSHDDLAHSPRGAGVKQYLNERGFRIIDALRSAANSHKSTPARVALAWLMARPSVTAPIASATKLEQLHDLVEATKLELSAETIESLNCASEYSQVESST